MKQNFIVNIPIKDRDGRVVGTKQVIRYEGLLARAHEDGLKSVHTELVQVPSKDNGTVAIVRAVVVTCRGTFQGIGDASPSNVNPRVTGHLLRVAETRAKARALRDAVNVGIVALEELEDVDDIDSSESQPSRTPTRSIASTAVVPAANGNAPAPQPEPRDDRMTHSQRRLLFRIAAERGLEADRIQKWLENVGLKPLADFTVSDASKLIDKLKANGHAGAAP
jgi:hypothetical protein